MLTRVQKGSNIYAMFDLKGQTAPLDKVSIMMINSNQNHSTGLATIALEEMNGRFTAMLFDVTGKITLREYVSKNISQEDFRIMLINLIDTLENFDEYMIDVRQVILDMDSVFINELDHSISFLCIAIKGKAFDGNLYEFFRTVVENSYVTTDNNGVSYFNKVWNVIRSDGFSLQNMKIAMTNPNQMKYSNDSQPVASSNATVKQQSQMQSNHAEVPKTVTVSTTPDFSLNSQSVQTKENDDKKKGLFSFLSSSKKKKEKVQPQAKSFSGFQGGVAGYLNKNKASTNAPMPQQQDQQPNIQASPVNINSLSDFPNQQNQQPKNFGGTTVLKSVPENPVSNGIQKQNTDNYFQSGTENNFNSSVQRVPNTMGTTVLNKQSNTQTPINTVGTTVLNPKAQNPKSPGTTVLKPQNVVKKTACLIRVANHERIFINKPVITIGRDSDNLDCNVHENTAIGHRHASVIRRENDYFIMDLNSVNHTYLNENIIQSGVEVKLSDGDEIILANEKFSFKII